MIDDTDVEILNILQDDARTSNADIARRIGMAPSAVHERIRKLEERGIIAGYTALIDPHVVGLGLLAFVFVRADGAAESSTESRLVEIPEVQELHHIAGEDCFLVKVRTRDTATLGQLLRRVKEIQSVRSTRTTVVLDTVKESPLLPRLTGEAFAAADD